MYTYNKEKELDKKIKKPNNTKMKMTTFRNE